MSRLTDAACELERNLARYPGHEASDYMNRRLIIRKALDEFGQQRYQEGHADGIGDVHDAQRHAEQAASG